MDPLTDHRAEAVHTIHHTILHQISETTVDTRATMKIAKTDKISTGTTIETEGTNRTHGTTREMGFRTGIEDRNRFDNRRRPTKYQHHRNQPRTKVIFEYTNQNAMELMQTVRNFVNFMKANPSSRKQFKTNKMSPCSFNNEVNESEIHTSSLEQV